VKLAWRQLTLAGKNMRGCTDREAAPLTTLGAASSQPFALVVPRFGRDAA
jgi:hypothetical protein